MDLFSVHQSHSHSSYILNQLKLYFIERTVSS